MEQILREQNLDWEDSIDLLEVLGVPLPQLPLSGPAGQGAADDGTAHTMPIKAARGAGEGTGAIPKSSREAPTFLSFIDFNQSLECV